VELLWDMVTDMEPEDGCLWIYDTDDRQTVAFISNGMEYLRDMIPEYKRDRATPRVLSGWLLIYGSWPNSRASCVDASPQTPITCDWHSIPPWGAR
jgi:hypothetical protein